MVPALPGKSWIKTTTNKSTTKNLVRFTPLSYPNPACVCTHFGLSRFLQQFRNLPLRFRPILPQLRQAFGFVAGVPQFHARRGCGQPPGENIRRRASELVRQPLEERRILIRTLLDLVHQAARGFEKCRE